MLFFPGKRQYRITPILPHLIKKMHYYLDLPMVLIYFETMWLVNAQFLHCFCLPSCCASPFNHASHMLEIRSRTKSTRKNITNFHPRQEVSAMSSCHSRQEDPEHCSMHWVTQNWQGHTSQPPEPSRPTHLRWGTELKGSQTSLAPVPYWLCQTLSAGWSQVYQQPQHIKPTTQIIQPELRY